MISSRNSKIPESATVAIADLAASMREAGETVIDFSAGRAAEHSPDTINRAAISAMQSGRTHQTPARGLPEYLEAAAAKLRNVNGLNVDARENVIATLGCKQGLVLSLLSVLDAGDEVIIDDPCFVSYGPTIQLFGGIPVVVPSRPGNRFCWSEDDLEAAVSDRTKAILLCSPNNPAGTVHTASDLQAIATVAIRHDLTVIADEIYEAVTWGGRRHQPIYALDGMESRAIGLMGMTKTYSMGGWRIGYAYASPKYIRAMTKVQQHLMTCASSFGQIGAAKALQPDVIASMRDLWNDWEARCRYVTDQLNGHHLLDVSMPEGGFYAWIDIRQTGLDSTDFCTRLIEEHSVAAVPGRAFGENSDGYVRVTCVRSWDELREGVKRFRAFAETAIV
ncbi:MAG: aminotransferase class I/II-fold pyridoxal phosphate-dependent enzyme [Pseudomonadota bacterium]